LSSHFRQYAVSFRESSELNLGCRDEDNPRRARKLKMHLRKFVREDWFWVCEWFKDAQLNRELGPIDELWLHHVLERTDGTQLVAEGKGVPVALIGCEWSVSPQGLHGITDIAVAPQLRSLGWGRQAVAKFIEWEGHPASEGWIAFVDPQNTAAQHFLREIGWRYAGEEEGMHRFELVGRKERRDH
jgi:ribosomal protein S18 acetylase RimI-like enzyme